MGCEQYRGLNSPIIIIQNIVKNNMLSRIFSMFLATTYNFGLMVQI